MAPRRPLLDPAAKSAPSAMTFRPIPPPLPLDCATHSPSASGTYSDTRSWKFNGT
jgi:hypothetical protein